MLAIRIAVTLAFVLAPVACGHRAVVERSYGEELDAGGEARDSLHQSVTLEREGDLEQAMRLVRERRFDDAIAIYRGLYRNSPSSSVRAEALLRWAQAEGTLLNPARDIDAAIARLDLLLSEFANSSLSQLAELERDRMIALRDGDLGP